MRKALFFLCFFIPFALMVNAQLVYIPSVPEKVTFADININFDDNARALIQKQIKEIIGKRQSWNKTLEQIAVYKPIIENVLLEEELPVEFIYLAIHQSKLLFHTNMKTTTAGPWQLTAKIAMDHGLSINNQIDERMNVVSSTYATAAYLKEINNVFDNWLSTLFYFYVGNGQINKFDLPDWTDKKNIYLNDETNPYILAFFACKIAVDYSLISYENSTNLTLLEYPNCGGKNLKDIAREFGVEEKSLRDFNSWILGDYIPIEKAYSVVIPALPSQIYSIKSKIEQDVQLNPENGDLGFPVIKKYGNSNGIAPVRWEINGLPGIRAYAGDTPTSLARKAGIDLEDFLEYNELKVTDPVLSKQVYYLASKHKKAAVPFHIVSEDETIHSIARKYGIRMKNILVYNRMAAPQKLQTGRVLWLREKRPKDFPIEIVSLPSINAKSIPLEKTPALFENKNQEIQPADIVQVKLNERKFEADSEQVLEDSKGVLPKAQTSTREEIVPETETNRVGAQMTKSRTVHHPNLIADDKHTYDLVIPDVGSKDANVPSDESGSEMSAEELDSEAYFDNSSRITHIVKKGQTLFSIAQIYGITVKDLLFYNNLKTSNRLVVGQPLVLYLDTQQNINNADKQPIKAKKEEINVQPSAFTWYHEVKNGETMYRISVLYNVSIKQIQEWNNLVDTVIRVGQKIKIIKKA
ncbi:LysM peptidoglycan-binding domain-containing protein [Runella salmonicolor]|uniref:LysM peptidoglycan-binding domain-containing protein n=1 Tax=Runella salmonicolor TaxID=2950278 RepID=A0ABT1FPZ6_9BACT|nr:LysM peptidoglycan-binding domain-containing protein [Runella salmonicolor]MCP1383836.1 LysM peptidoglycan-binding domain-containing protein [Runella salmonicolor]